jgi:hypothetical protein
MSMGAVLFHPEGREVLHLHRAVLLRWTSSGRQTAPVSMASRIWSA